MGGITTAEKGAVFFAVFSKNKDLINKTALFFAEEIKSRMVLKSNFINFNQTGYYEKEMGKGLKKRLFLTDKIIWTNKISDIKLSSNKIEESLTLKAKRRVNIDPGYITLAKICLATTKNYAHRIYTGKGIYTEITMNYFQKGINFMPWTYPDYQTDEFTDFFRKAKNELKRRLL